MKLFFLCFVRIVLYTLGVVTVCGLAIELCYRLCFALMGKRAGRIFWFLTSFLGTPVHEGGHALMCLLFAHRIEKMRLIPTRAGGAMVEHSYDRRNPYAVFGNLWIGLGPIFSGLGVIWVILCLVYPESVRAYRITVETLLDGNAATAQIQTSIKSFLHGLLTERTHTVPVRLAAITALFSMALHVRLSAADVRGMVLGLPGYAVISALVALVAALMGETAVTALTMWLQNSAWLLVSLFGLILLFGLTQLVLAAFYRGVLALIQAIRRT